MTTQEAGNKGLKDNKQLEFASNQEMSILTHDRADYEQLAQDYFTNNKNHNGIIIVFPHPPQVIAERLLRILNDLTADEMKNQIIYI